MYLGRHVLILESNHMLPAILSCFMDVLLGDYFHRSVFVSMAIYLPFLSVLSLAINSLILQIQYLSCVSYWGQNMLESLLKELASN